MLLHHSAAADILSIPQELAAKPMLSHSVAADALTMLELFPKTMRHHSVAAADAQTTMPLHPVAAADAQTMMQELIPKTTLLHSAAAADALPLLRRDAALLHINKIRSGRNTYDLLDIQNLHMHAC